MHIGEGPPQEPSYWTTKINFFNNFTYEPIVFFDINECLQRKHFSHILKVPPA